MSRATLSVVLNYTPNRQGESVVRIRIIKDRLTRFWPLSLSLPGKQFNPNATRQLQNWVRKSCPEHGVYNERIKKAYDRASAAVAYYEDRGRPYTATEVRDYLEQGGHPEWLLSFFEQHIADRRRSAGEDLGKLKTADGYVSTLKVLRWFLRETHKLPDTLPDTDLDKRYWRLSSFTKQDVLDLRAWMEQSYAPNSVTSYLRNLRHVLYLAADAELVSRERFPMRGIVFTVHRKKVARLVEAEINQLATAPEPIKRRGGNIAVTSPVHGRPLALAMYYVHGARLGDAITWRMSQYVIEGEQHRIKYRTGKNKREMSVLLSPEAIALLAPYRLNGAGQPKQPADFLFPYLPAGYDALPVGDRYLELRRARIRARKHVKEMAEKIGLTKPLTPHIMRHSFADMMRRSAVPLETRQKVLGHGDARVTQMYEEQFDQEAVDSVSLLYEIRTGPPAYNSSTTNQGAEATTAVTADEPNGK